METGTDTRLRVRIEIADYTEGEDSRLENQLAISLTDSQWLHVKTAVTRHSPLWKIFSNWIVARVSALCAAIPANCSLCGQICKRSSVCARCISALPRLRQPCRRCALEQTTVTSVNSTESCGFCAANEPAIERCYSLLKYCTPADRLILRFKYQGNLADGKSLALLLAEHITARVSSDDLPELLIPVPLHLSRWQERGFNQALELSNTLSKVCNIPTRADLVVRTRMTGTQTTMPNADARRRNLRGAFRVRSPDELSEIKHVAIVDDVITTLATVDSLARCLRNAGIERVDAWCLARATR